MRSGDPDPDPAHTAGRGRGQPEAVLTNQRDPLEQIVVAVDDRQPVDAAPTPATPPGLFVTLLRRGLERLGVRPPAEVGLIFVGIDEMGVLNREHMGGEGPTDVLAFPIDGLSPAPAQQPTLVGDIVICPAVAARSDQRLEDELALLVVHGALHLIGHDHAEPGEAEVMQRLQGELLAAEWRAV